jgi:hypothetical protein
MLPQRQAPDNYLQMCKHETKASTSIKLHMGTAATNITDSIAFQFALSCAKLKKFMHIEMH